jgi:hypothetical protein
VGLIGSTCTALPSGAHGDAAGAVLHDGSAVADGLVVSPQLGAVAEHHLLVFIIVGGVDAEADLTSEQGLTLVHFSAQHKPFWSHLPVSPCLIDGGGSMHPTYPTKCA